MNNVKLLNMLPAPRNHHCQNMSSGICITAVPTSDVCFRIVFFLSLVSIEVHLTKLRPICLNWAVIKL